ncbi:MAG: tRNA (N6-isopentenyl adenosine(37)-C2)-methylthiotransferase MiaB [Clostridia bacterium]
MQFDIQYEFIQKLKIHTANSNKYCYVETFGCAQNLSDTEKIKGILLECGYTDTNDFNLADIIILNTCAVRDLAEKKAFGRLGFFKNFKSQKPELVIGFCGCMAAESGVCEDIIKKYRFVDFILPPSSITSLPEILTRVLKGEMVVIKNQTDNLSIAENVPVLRQDTSRAFVTIMYGCNNFCSYCIVPYTRGRERSRDLNEILSETKNLVESGYKEITFLGQNVNSYGSDLKDNVDFSELLFKANEIEGDFLIRFLTSHPKDMSKKLIDTIATCHKISTTIHLPVQSGSNDILSKMNRKYTVEQYLELIEYAKSKISNVTFSSDIIIGFPEETNEDFEQTLSLIKKVRFDTLYTFIYSKRRGTPADKNPNQIEKSVKNERFNRLTTLQNEIALEINKSLISTTARVLVEGYSKKNSKVLSARTTSNKIVLFIGDENLIGKFVNVKITDCNTFSLFADVL